MFICAVAYNTCVVSNTRVVSNIRVVSNTGVLFQEELAEGLHLIDFEQLKIENQTYNEKIEERNEASVHVILSYSLK